MNRLVLPGARCGSVSAPSSKSLAHRSLICAALSAGESRIACGELSLDVAATVRCLNQLGADIQYDQQQFRVAPIRRVRQGAELFCGESGSTLRFLLPVVGALGAEAIFHMEGRLSQRPMAEYEAELAAHGMKIERRGCALHVSGRLQSGSFVLPGDLSSQYFSGLLLALPLVMGESTVAVRGRLESGDYVHMTLSALEAAGVEITSSEQGYRIHGGQRYAAPEWLTVEGDYSSASAFLTMGALSDRGITVGNLPARTVQGDRRILAYLRGFGAAVRQTENAVFVKKDRLTGQCLDAADCPDLMPSLCVLAALAEGETRVTHARRLRYKESDRLAGIVRLICDLGGTATETQDGLLIRGQRELSGGPVHVEGDHRLAMAAALAASGCREPVVIPAAECVEKSYPRFWRDFDGLEVEA